jgi:hypothetical protein
VVGGVGLLAYHLVQWFADGLWRPLALADWIAAPTTRSLLGLNALMQAAFAVPLAADLIAVGLIALLVGRNIVSWRALKARAASPREA